MPTGKKSVADTIIDFSKEETGGGGGIRIKEGTYRAKIVKAVPTVSAEKGTEGLAVTFQILDGKYKGKKIVDTLWVSPKAYSRFRTLLEACEADVPKRIKLSSIASAVKGSTLYIEVQDEEREGYSTRSRVTFEGFMSEDAYDPDDEDTDDEDDEDLDDDEELDEDDEETEEDEFDEMDRAELKSHIKENDLDVTVRKSMSDDDLREAIREAAGDEDEDEEDEEPEPPKRRRASKAKAAPAKTRSRNRKKATDDEDLDELDLDDL
jgi:hypothetical protein